MQPSLTANQEPPSIGRFLSQRATMELNEIRQLVTQELEAVDKLIAQELHSDIPLIQTVGQYIIHSGGKRLRPLLVLLTNQLYGQASERGLRLAAIIEFIHTATLLHDDVVDASEVRRNRQTANAVWGNQASVLVGDFLYSRAFQMMVKVNELRIMDILADTTNTIAEGEVLQLLNCQNLTTSEADYLKTIQCKTAKLFEAGAMVGALAGGASAEDVASLGRYGMSLGIAFQLVDDLFDYESDVETMGKNQGDDLAEGKLTLPIIHALERGTAEQVQLIEQAIASASRDQFDAVKSIIESTGAITYTSELAKKYVKEARESLASLPPSNHREALHQLAEFAVARTM